MAGTEPWRGNRGSISTRRGRRGGRSRPSPSARSARDNGRGDGIADQRARARADNAASNRAAGTAAGERRSDERAASGAERAADQRALLLLGRVATGKRQPADESQSRVRFFFMFPPLGSIESGADPVAVVIVAKLRASAARLRRGRGVAD